MLKAYIDSYTVSSQNVAANATINFAVDDVSAGLCITRNSSGAFLLRGAGVYEVAVTVVAQAAAAGPVGVQLLNGSTVVPGASSAGVAAAVGDNVPLSFTKLIRVLPSCCAVNNTASLTVQATAEAVVPSCNIVITRIA